MANELNLVRSTHKDIRVEYNRDLNYEIQCDIYSGETFSNHFQFSGYTGATLEVRVKYNDYTTILTFSTNDNSILLGNDGVLTLNKTAAQMSTIRSSQYVYDLVLSSSTQKRVGFLKGKFIVEETVTR